MLRRISQHLTVLCIAVVPLAIAAACTSTVSGEGQQVGAAATSTASPTDDRPNSQPTGRPSSRPSSSAESSEDPSSESLQGTVCESLTDDQLSDIFGEPVTVGRFGGGQGCDFQAELTYLIIDFFETRALESDYEAYPGGRKFTIGGLPAYQINDPITMVSMSLSPDPAGEVGTLNGHHANEDDFDLVVDLLELISQEFSVD